MRRSIDSAEFSFLKEAPIGKRLRYFRSIMKQTSSQEYSTRALAKRIGVSAQSLTAIERGESKNPTYKLIYRISKDFNVPMEVFADEYYEGEEKLFEIGHEHVIELPDDIDIDEVESISFVTKSGVQTMEVNPREALDLDKQIGLIIYQKSPSQSPQIIYNTEKKSNDIETVKLLSKVLCETELSFNNYDDIRNRNPLNQAYDIYEGAKNISFSKQSKSKELLKNLLESISNESKEG